MATYRLVFHIFIYGTFFNLINVHANLTHKRPNNEFFFEGFQNINNQQDDTKFKAGSNISLERSHSKQWKSTIDVKLRLTSGQDPILAIPEAKTTYQYRFLLGSIGRSKIDWSESDKFWSIGAINNRTNFSFLDNSQDGLVGVRLKSKKYKGFSSELFFSYINLPELLPKTEVENGKVTSESEWARSTPEAVIVNNREVNIHYELTEVNYNNLIFNESYGAKLEKEWKYTSLEAFGIYKPENRLRFSIVAYYDIPTDRVIANIHPFSNHEFIWGGTVIQKMNKLLLTLSYFSINPSKVKKINRPNTPYIQFEQKVESKNYLDLQLKLHKFTISYLKQFNQRADQYNFFSGESRWRDAVGIKQQVRFSDEMTSEFNLKYDISKKDAVLDTKLNYFLSKKVSTTFGIELIHAPDINSFWADFRENDKLYATIRYLF